MLAHGVAVMSRAGVRLSNTNAIFRHVKTNTPVVTAALRSYQQQSGQRPSWSNGKVSVLGAFTAFLGSFGVAALLDAEEALPAPADDSKLHPEVVATSPSISSKDIPSAKPTDKTPTSGLRLFGGNGNPALTAEIARCLNILPGNITVGRFADGEVNVMVHENVRGKDVYIVQPTCTPVNENLMELLLLVSTMRRASARRITAVIPYYGYARQDRKMTARVPISAADVARLLEAMGVDRVIAIDLHCGQIQGFFGPRVPVDNLDGGCVGVSYFGNKKLVNPVVVSPDAGGVYRAKKFRDGLMEKHGVDAGLAMIIKQRAKANEIERMDLVGNVEGCDAIIVDDMIDTAGTLVKAAQSLADMGARRVFAFASHGIFSPPAEERILNSVLEEVVVVNTIPFHPIDGGHSGGEGGKIVCLSIAPLIADAIRNIHNKQSVSMLFDNGEKRTKA